MIKAQDMRIDNDAFIDYAYRSTGADTVLIVTNDTIRFITHKDGEGDLAFFILSSDFSHEIGYEGITDVGISLNSEGNIIAIKILASEDTPSYVRRIKKKWFLEQFIGAEDSTGITLITGATKSSGAMARSVMKARECFLPILIDYINKTDRASINHESEYKKNQP